MALHQLWSSCLVIYSLGLRMKGASFSGSFLLPSTLLLSCPPCTASFNVSGMLQVPLLGYTWLWEVGAGSSLQSQFLGLFSPDMTSALSDSGQALGSWALSCQAVFWVKEHSQEAEEEAFSRFLGTLMVVLALPLQDLLSLWLKRLPACPPHFSWAWCRPLALELPGPGELSEGLDPPASPTLLPVGLLEP